MKPANWAMLACMSAGCGQAIAAADPADANAVVPATTYRSPFTGYQPLGEDKNTAWKDANDTVRVIGGWRAYAKEAAEAAKAGVTKPAPPTAPSTVPAPAAPGTPSLPAPPATPTPPTHKHGG